MARHNSSSRTKGEGEPPRWKTVAVLAGGLIFNLTMGSMYTFGNLNLYITSYMRHKSHIPIRYKDTAWITTSAVIGGGLMIPFGGKLEQTIGPRWGALLGGFLMSSGVLLSAWTVRSYPLFLLTYGIQFGLANGIAFPCPLACAFRWMPKRRGLASGVILSGVGLSALVLGPIQTWYVNPDNVRPDVAPYAAHPEERYFDDPQVLDRLPKLFFWSGLVYGVIQFIGACLLIDPPEPSPPPYSHRKRVSTEADESSEAHMLHRVVDPQLSPSEALTTPQFWLLWALFFLNSHVVSFLATFWKVLGHSEGRLSDHTLAYMGSTTAAIANCLGRVGWGYLTDQFTFKFCVMALALIVCVFGLSIRWAARWGVVPFFVWLFALYFCVGGNFAMFPAATAHTFGAQHFGPNYGLIYTARVASSLLVASLLAYTYHPAGLAGVTFCIGMCSLLSIFLAAFFDPQPLRLRLDAFQSDVPISTTERQVHHAPPWQTRHHFRERKRGHQRQYAAR
ncbi:unnamed protein product [Vitrella brassicaformis CCMP3155]|uniref:Major facilitator superfamily (MFS) profile domain-containing protein n=2 Tax=Vitrella brassicaformis TaxID=1169539 RepID=A0A0G4EVM3_VITBC|nr:unnamed protein product [Vitrella brassicaformis CCMP3155]|eukprot:CEM02339.1 unnamed protein product [Vitrella brassicaformis CCMP3155]